MPKPPGSPKLARRLSVRAMVGKLSLWVAVAGAFAYAAIAGPLAHHRMHARVDAWLGDLAERLLAHYSADDPPPHVQAEAIWLWGIDAYVAEPTEVVVSSTGEVLAGRGELNGLVPGPAELANLFGGGNAPTPSYLDLTPASAEPHWVAAVVGNTPQGRVAAVVGLPHGDIDGIVFGTIAWALLPAALLLVGLAVVAWLFAHRIGTDLETLRKECASLDFARVEYGTHPAPEFRVSQSAPEEIDYLSHTLRMSIERWRASVQAQSRFLAEAAHELRTPLTALRGELEVALRRERSPAEYREALEGALVDAKRLGELAEELLAASKERARMLHIARGSLSEALHESAQRAHSLALASGVGLHIAPAPHAAWAHFDAVALGRVLDNLVSNALRHGEGGRVVLMASAPEGSTPELWVADDGPGLAENVRAALFVPFVRGEAKAGSHGLGLHLARELVERMGGELTLHSGAPSDGERPAALISMRGAVWRIRLPPAAA